MENVKFLARGVKKGVKSCKEFIDIADKNMDESTTFLLWSEALQMLIVTIGDAQIKVAELIGRLEDVEKHLL